MPQAASARVMSKGTHMAPEPFEEIEVLMDPLLAQIRTLLEEHTATTFRQISSAVSSALNEREQLMDQWMLQERQEQAEDKPTSNLQFIPSEGKHFVPSDRQAPQALLSDMGDMATDHQTNARQVDEQLQGQTEHGSFSEKTDGRMSLATEASGTTTFRSSLDMSKMGLDEKDHHERQLASEVHKQSTRLNSTIGKLEPSKHKARAVKIVEARSFEMSIAFLILLNSVFIGIEVEVTKDDFNNNKHSIFFIGQIFFCCAFSLELVLRMLALGLFGFFTSSNHLLWNYVDLCIVVSSVAELLIHIVILSVTSDGIDNDMRTISNVRVLRILRVTRLMRALRMVRVVRFVRDLRLLVGSIFSTLYTLIWSMLLLLMIIYVFAIMFTEEAAEHLREIDAEDHDIRRFFGSISEAMFTLFKSISGGLDWDDPVRALANLSKLTVYLFAIFIAFVYFAVLNVVTSVFCSTAIESSLRDRENLIHTQIRDEKAWKKNMAEVFKNLDNDDSNTITIHEFEMGLQDSRMKAYLASLELDPHDAWTLFKLLDTDKTQSIDIDEFIMGCLRLKGQARSIDMALLMYNTKSLTKRQEAFMKHVEEQLSRLSANNDAVMKKITSTTMYNTMSRQVSYSYSC